MMKIAVTYENGEVFQHFGHTETFKVYEVEDGKILSSEIIGSDGNGHEALAGLLANQRIDVLICGGIGGAFGTGDRALRRRVRQCGCCRWGLSERRACQYRRQL